MVRLAWIIVALGCGADVPKDVEALADRACGCADKACADRVADDYLGYLENHMDERARSSGDRERTDQASEKLVACVFKAGVEPQAFTKRVNKLADMQHKLAE